MVTGSASLFWKVNEAQVGVNGVAVWIGTDVTGVVVEFHEVHVNPGVYVLELDRVWVEEPMHLNW